MAVIDIAPPAALPAVPRKIPRLRFGPPIITLRRARAWRRFGAVTAALTMLAGSLVSIHAWHHTYNVTYGWLAIGTYLVISTAAQLLSVLPKVTVEA